MKIFMKKKSAALPVMALVVIGMIAAGCGRADGQGAKAGTWEANVLKEAVFTDDQGGGTSAWIYVPETNDVIRYATFQNNRTFEDKMLPVFESDAANGALVSQDNTSALSQTIKEYMKNRDIRLMMFSLNGNMYANIRKTDPEAFIFAGPIPGMRPSDGNVLKELPYVNNGIKCLVATIYVPEIDESMRYQAYPNGPGVEDLLKGIEADAASIEDNNEYLSSTVKDYMRSRDIRFMVFQSNGQWFANVRAAEPESFAFIVSK